MPTELPTDLHLVEIEVESWKLPAASTLDW